MSIRTPEDAMINPTKYVSAAELLHAYVAVLKLAEDHAGNVAHALERSDPDDDAIAGAYDSAGKHIDQAASAIHDALFG